MVSEAGSSGAWSAGVFHGSAAWKMLPVTVYPGPGPAHTVEPDEPDELVVAALLVVALLVPPPIPLVPLVVPVVPEAPV
jgi:hypothetical protein